MFLPSLEFCIGIWGFGRVGKSVAKTLIDLGYTIAVMDSSRKVLSDNFLLDHGVPTFFQTEHDDFFQLCKVVVPSPGIDIRECVLHNHVWLSELDLFQALWQKPIIAVTGSVGKTTVVSMLADICVHNNISVALGGNIGNAACTLLEVQARVQYAILEVSSFQLALCKSFSPDIAVITNVYENHLDRHSSYQEYWQAKAAIMCNQKQDSISIVPWGLREQIQQVPNLSRNTYYVCSSKLDLDLIDLADQEVLFYLDTANKSTIEEIGVYKRRNYQTQIMPKSLISRTFAQNALTLHAVLYALTNNNVSKFYFDIDYTKQEHRLEIVTVAKGFTFINDSKATTVASTTAAVARYNSQSNIILFVGGLSKGVDRQSLIATLPSYITHIVCFGTEALTLAQWSKDYGKPSTAYINLRDAFIETMKWAPEQSLILFSPAGSSYDLYQNYEERGIHFKQLVYEFANTY